MEPGQLTITADDDGRLHRDSELDAYTAPLLEQAVADGRRGQRAVVDLSCCPFVDSSGLRALTELHHRLDARGGQLVLRTVPAQVQRVLEITGLDHRFDKREA